MIRFGKALDIREGEVEDVRCYWWVSAAVTIAFVVLLAVVLLSAAEHVW